MAVNYDFSFDISTRNDVMAWAREGDYSNDENFTKFFNGLPLLQGVSIGHRILSWLTPYNYSLASFLASTRNTYTDHPH